MKKRLAIIAAAVVVFAAAFVIKESGKETPGPAPGGEATSAQGPLPRLVDLGSDKCVPCKQMAPILEELSREYAGVFTVEVLDVRQDPAVGRTWGIRVIPTQIFLDASGTERFRHEGFMAKDAILDRWREIGVDLSPAASRARN